MPLHILSHEREFNEIILERRLNIVVFTVCWSLGSKMILPTICDLAYEKSLSHVNFYRVDIDEDNQEFIQRLNIVTIPTIQWYFYGNKLHDLIGVDIEHFTTKTQQLALIYKRKTLRDVSRMLSKSSTGENITNETIEKKTNSR